MTSKHNQKPVSKRKFSVKPAKRLTVPLKPTPSLYGRAFLPIKNPGRWTGMDLHGAENETRTRDPNLGKVVLYQLSYFRIGNNMVDYKVSFRFCQ